MTQCWMPHDNPAPKAFDLKSLMEENTILRESNPPSASSRPSRPAPAAKAAAEKSRTPAHQRVERPCEGVAVEKCISCRVSQTSVIDIICQWNSLTISGSVADSLPPRVGSSDETSPGSESKKTKGEEKPKRKAKDKKAAKKESKKDKSGKKKTHEDDLAPLAQKDRNDDDQDNDDMDSDDELSGMSELLDLKGGVKSAKKPAATGKKTTMKRPSKKRAMGDEELLGFTIFQNLFHGFTWYYLHHMILLTLYTNINYIVSGAL